MTSTKFKFVGNLNNVNPRLNIQKKGDHVKYLDLRVIQIFSLEKENANVLDHYDTGNISILSNRHSFFADRGY
jgi:hypothetical protein